MTETPYWEVVLAKVREQQRADAQADNKLDHARQSIVDAALYVVHKTNPKSMEMWEPYERLLLAVQHYKRLL